MTPFRAISAWFGHQRPMFCFSNACYVSIYKVSGFLVSICDFWPLELRLLLRWRRGNAKGGWGDG